MLQTNALSRRTLLGAAAFSLTAGQAVAAGAAMRVTVLGFGASSLLGAGATEESLVALLIEELIGSGRFAVIEAEDADPADPPRLLRATVTKFESRSGGGLDIGGFGGALGLGGEKFELAVSLRLLDGATRQVLAVAAGSAKASGSSVKAGVVDDDGRTLGGERRLGPAVELACRTAIREAIGKLLRSVG